MEQAQGFAADAAPNQTLGEAEGLGEPARPKAETYHGKPCAKCGNTERRTSNRDLTCVAYCNPARRVARHRYLRTEKGRASNARSSARYFRTERGRATLSRYRATLRGASRRWRERNTRKGIESPPIEVLLAHLESTPCVCEYCGVGLDWRFKTKRPHMDHRLPISRGGDGSVENLAIACKRCNLEKGCWTAEEYAEYRRVKLAAPPRMLELIAQQNFQWRFYR